MITTSDIIETINTDILILHDPHYKSHNEINETISHIFNNLNKLNKGIVYKENNSSDSSNILRTISIDNKYYQCNLSLKTHPINLREELASAQFEAVIIYWTANNLTNDRLSSIINSLASKPNICIALFEEDRAFLSSLSHYDEFVGFAIDNNMEIITGIKESNLEDDEDGVGALNMSLQSCHWSDSIMKNRTQHNITDEVKQVKEVKEIEKKEEGYQQLQDENDFDSFLDKINHVRKTNMNEKLTDEERRMNAENSILMLAKYMNFDLDEMGEGDEGDEVQQDEK